MQNALFARLSSKKGGWKARKPAFETDIFFSEDPPRLSGMSNQERRFQKTKILLVMKFTAVFLFLASFHVSAKTYSQKVSFSGKEVTLKSVFAAIEQQAGYVFFYDAQVLKEGQPVTIEAKNVPVETFLKEVFKKQPLDYSIKSKTVFVIRKERGARTIDVAPEPPIDVRGRIINEKGEPAEGLTVSVKGSKRATSSNENGIFELNGVKEDAILVISGITIETIEVRLSGRTDLSLIVKTKIALLDETVVIAYGTTTRRLSTGNITKVGAEEIASQPVANPLAALQGRVPGLIVTPSSGLPGSSFKVELRGRTALDLNITDDQPLFVVDGVPLAANNNYIGTMISALGYPTKSTTATNPGGISPFNSINPQDIESIEVLKDADATAIYGSRGANGVVLITTKKGKSGKTSVSFNLNTGFSKVSRTLEMMNTQQYLAMRHEAFNNDGVTPNNSNGFDLLSWDTTRYTDFKKLLIGGTARSTDVQASISGGNNNLKYLIAGGYHRETTVYPGDLAYKRGTMHFNLDHSSDDKKFNISLSGNFSSDKNNLLTTDLTPLIILPPHFKIYDSLGNLAWNENGVVYFDNPLSNLKEKYSAEVDNLLANLQISYKLAKDLIFRTSLGYNNTLAKETTTSPAAAQNPAYFAYRRAEFGTNQFKSWIIEPQAEYNKNLGKGKLNLLAGGTWQNQFTDGSSLEASGYGSDNLLGSLSGATKITAVKTYSQYRYQAVFGRLNYQWDGKYIINFSGRRDGSSRFGPGKQFANFGSAGAGWIFSNEPFVGSAMPFLSFGKLRASYGTTGNDKITEYQYLDTYAPTATNYQDSTSLKPTKLFNPDYRWEQTKKLEIGLEMSFLKDRIVLSASFYRNRSSNQLIRYKLPYTTGFTNVIANFPAMVQNSGWEILVNASPLRRQHLEWTTSLNITIPKNKLLSFPDLANSSYYSVYVVDQPLNLIYGYKYLGVDPATGHYMLEDYNKDGRLSSREDYQVLGNLDPKFYGGIQNNIRYKNLQFGFFIQFRKQLGQNFKSTLVSVPGTINNMPVDVMDHWQEPGDITPIRKFTQRTSETLPYNYLRSLNKNSDGVYSDASFVRLKTVSISYNLPGSWLEKIHINTCRIYFQAQNLLTLTNYMGADPEVQSFRRLPPLQTYTSGIQLSF